MKNQTILIYLMFLFTSCFSDSSSDPEEAFQYWAGTNPPKEIEVLNGQYYQSPHFSLEYELFLKFKTTEKWWTEFISENKLELDQQNEGWKRLADLPEWFAPGSNFLVYSKNDQFDRSRYFFDSKNGICYIYETVGM
jgi:hypothetical protein